jgi:hypothetical protein
MAKAAHDDVFDAALNKIATANVMTLCSSEPTTRTEAITTYMLADVTMTTGDGSGDYTIANGDSSGRKITVTAQAGEAVTNSGTGTYIALCDGSDLLLKTTCTGIAVLDSGTVDFPAWDFEITDPA